ncbi:MAG: DUF6285 domain-containing protein [Caulobacteraceae bacterium]
MQDQPSPPEIIAQVARFLREEAAPAASGALNFKIRVAANALEMMTRQLELAPKAEAAEAASLEKILGEKADLLAMNAELCRRIAAGEIAEDDPALLAHLWATTMAKLSVDQPTYAAYQASLQEHGSARE